MLDGAAVAKAISKGIRHSQTTLAKYRDAFGPLKEKEKLCLVIDYLFALFAFLAFIAKEGRAAMFAALSGFTWASRQKIHVSKSAYPPEDSFRTQGQDQKKKVPILRRIGTFMQCANVKLPSSGGWFSHPRASKPYPPEDEKALFSPLSSQ